MLALKTIDICDNFYEVICKPMNETKDPTGWVKPDVEGERMALEVYEAVLSDHPNWSPQETDNELATIYFNDSNKKWLEAGYRLALHFVKTFIEHSPEFNTWEKKRIIRRLNRVELQLPPPASIYEDEPDLIRKNDAYYERTSNGKIRLRVGGGYLFITRSLFNLVYTLAHELAHAIDPCEMRSIRLAFPAYDHLTACFLDNKLIATRKNREECAANDQLSEVFADYIAVQITASLLETYSIEFDRQQLIDAARNSIRDLCEQEEEINEKDYEFHPPPQVRIGLFEKNPRIRQLFGCSPLPEERPYCSFQWSQPPKKP